jgi:hypothetical protein
MNKIFKKLILSIFTILIIGSFAGQANAQIPPTIQFENTPLFGEASFAPGNSVSRWVKITNNTDVVHRSVVRALSVNNDDNLGDVIMLEIKQGDVVIFNDTFSNFFAESEVILPQVGIGETNTIDFIATFTSGAGNEYQNDNMNFSLNVGLEDVAESTDTTTTIGGGSSSGSYITFGQKLLSISNESATPSGQVVGDIAVFWNTNIPATSQVIYGLTSDGPYNLDLTAPHFGYSSSTTEDIIKVLDHSVLLTGLIPGQTYIYRVVSRASPPTISFEHQFTVPLLTQAGLVLGASAENNNESESEGVSNGAVLGETTSATEETPDFSNNLATVLASGFGNILFIYILIALLILLIIYLIWRFWLRRKYKKDLM